MKLKKLTLKNFQGVRSLTLDFDGRSAGIYGDNGTGKTTVYNAVTWLLFDKASTGAKNFTPKTKGPDGDLHHLEHSAEGTFVAENGQIFTLKKTYKEIWKKKRGSASEEFGGHTVEYEIDGVPSKERDFTAAVLARCGGDAEKPKMLTMPDYFPEVLGWEDRRRILLTVCGDVDDEEILQNTSELADLQSFLRIPGTEDQYYSPDEYRAIATAKKSKINTKLLEIPARIDEATQAIPDTSTLDAEEIKANIKAIEDERDRILTERTINPEEIEAANIRKQIAEIRSEIEEKRAEHREAEGRKSLEDDRSLEQVRRDIFSKRMEIREAERLAEEKQSETKRIEREREKLLTQYKEVSARTWDAAQAVCPTCGRDLPEDKIEQLKSDFNLRKASDLEEINARGKREASREMIERLQREYDAEMDKAAALRKEVDELTETERTLKAKEPEKIPFEATDAYKALMAQISTLTATLNDTVTLSTEAKKAYDAKICAVSEALKAEQAKLAQFSVAETQRSRITELEDEEKKLAGEYEELERGLHLCDLFTRAKVKALDEKINNRFETVRFRLFQEQINGGLKEDCEVMIPTPDGRLVPYAFANNAARINAGLEIIDTLSKHWGVEMPIFIDNAEGVTRIRKTDAQTIRLVVSEKDKQLRLETEAEIKLKTA